MAGNGHSVNCMLKLPETAEWTSIEECPFCGHSSRVVGGVYCGCKRNATETPWFTCRCEYMIIPCCGETFAAWEENLAEHRAALQRAAETVLRNARLAARHAYAS